MPGEIHDYYTLHPTGGKRQDDDDEPGYNLVLLHYRVWNRMDGCQHTGIFYKVIFYKLFFLVFSVLVANPEKLLIFYTVVANTARGLLNRENI